MDKSVPNVMSRIKSSFAWGPIIGLWAIIYTVIEGIILGLADIFLPDDEIDIARSFQHEEYAECPEKFGDHKVFVNTQDSRYLCSKHKNMKIIDENFDSFENRSISNLNTLQRYMTVKPEIGPKFQPRKPIVEEAKEPEEQPELVKLITPEVHKERELSDLDKSKDSNSDSRSQNASQIDTKSNSEDQEVTSENC